MKLRLVCLCLIAMSFIEQASVMSGQEVRRVRTKVGHTQETYRGGLVAPPFHKPRFVLTDTSGAPFDFWKRTQGSVTLLFFGYTYCPDQCPMHMANIGAALKKIPAGISDQVQLVFVTTDPARDTPTVLRRWLDLFDDRFIGLTGTDAAIEAAQKSAVVPPAQKARFSNGIYAVA